ncbi:thiamine pyrophosphate-binding protein [Xaviernesmea oryzae]|uniref:Thiamine pyrophosphate-binding protein n=1 Tax=Xaviernesmea oryzae TaxID=464029 RepID=A0A1Q9AS90_9HYPH|nr:thiamine pyrophosphate-binding protein [Xaviernesmea oryzae]OLP58251.1 thiamine pyrophosphate-binding protein [Xaviernesmea oryzae]SEL44861.1 acetolactate synthase-1/2/3 large subunit [Xaviernesmea oryzae]
MRVADYIMQRLEAAGIGHVFLVTGRGALFLTDALAKNTALTAVSVHHEQSAAFAAIAYAHQSSGIGACLVSTGCASTNAMTGVLSAWQDGVPCIFISGQNTLKETTRQTGLALRTYGQQEADIVSLVTPITKYATMITAPEQIVEAMDRALTLANTGRKGPVWIDVPLDLQSAQIDPEQITGAPDLVPDRPEPQEDDVQAVLAALAGAERPVVLIGSGVRGAGAEDAFRRFVEGRGLPVTFAASAPDTYGSAHDLSIGSVGAMGCSRAGNFAIQNADLVLVLGCRLTSLTTGPDFCKFARAAQIVVVDIDPAEHAKDTIRIDRLVHADIAAFLARLEAADTAADAGRHAHWAQQCRRWKGLFAEVEPAFRHEHQVDLYELADRLPAHLPGKATIITDSGLNEVILPTNMHFTSDMSCIHPAMQGAMGFALPATIGATFAGAGAIVAVIGDGSIMMNLQELETIRYHALPIKIVVINNNVYSIIRRRQQDMFRKRVIGTDPQTGVSCPDFSKVADCFGLDYVKIDHRDRLDQGLSDMMGRAGPVLCEIIGRPDQEYIELGQARSLSDRRFVRRPLEDQIPFLDRDLFLREMIVEPIDQ